MGGGTLGHVPPCRRGTPSYSRPVRWMEKLQGEPEVSGKMFPKKVNKNRHRHRLRLFRLEAHQHGGHPEGRAPPPIRKACVRACSGHSKSNEIKFVVCIRLLIE